MVWFWRAAFSSSRGALLWLLSGGPRGPSGCYLMHGLDLHNLCSSRSPVLVTVQIVSSSPSPCPSTRMSFLFLCFPFLHDDGAIGSFVHLLTHSFTGPFPRY